MIVRRIVVALALILLAAACSLSPQQIDAATDGQGVLESDLRRPPTTALQVEGETSETTVRRSAGLVRADGRGPISLAFAGDTSFHNSLHLFQPLRAVSDTLSLPDFTIVNLETAVAPAQIGRPPVQKQFLFRSDPQMVDQLAEAGVDAVSLANNHALDFGPAALQAGVERLNRAGIETVGGGADAEAAYKPLIATVGDWTIGIAAFSRVPCDWSWTGENVRPQVAWACPAFLDEADAVVNALVDDVDLAVVMVHGGTEGQLCPDPIMRSLNTHWADLGVGLVVNSHPHVVQGVTSIGETVVVQSTGNFAFPPSFGLTANSALFIATLSEDGLFLSLEPMVSEGGVLSRGTAERRSAILKQVDSHSSGWRVLADGRLVQDPAWAGLCGDGSPQP